MPPVEPGPGGKITVRQAAALAGVGEGTVRAWINRGYLGPGGGKHFLPVAWRYKGRLLLDPVEVAKAERATAERARRIIVPTAA